MWEVLPMAFQCLQSPEAMAFSNRLYSVSGLWNKTARKPVGSTP